MASKWLILGLCTEEKKKEISKTKVKQKRKMKMNSRDSWKNKTKIQLY